uniref:LPXTG cell wall anchor domain-containing protein n=1 Tax=Radiobacillus sp. PE A8.2 TaxID=3380349 RepID=UPI00388FB62D
IPHFSTYGVFAEVDDDDASDDADDELPDTATSTYNWILAGVIFLVLGLAFIIVLKRKDLLARFGKSKE